MEQSLPLYELYVSWQDRREQRAALLARVLPPPGARASAALPDSLTEMDPKLLRPIELFYARVKVHWGVHP